MTRFAAAAFCLLASGVPALAAPLPPAIVVFFPDWSGAVDDNARAVVATVADRVKKMAQPHLTVAGYADNAGTQAANLYLTQLRAQRVADLLEADGVPASEITIEAKGAQRAPGIASRRVEITVSGQ